MSAAAQQQQAPSPLLPSPAHIPYGGCERNPTTGKLHGPRIVIADPSKRRVDRLDRSASAYVPGQYDAFLPVRIHLDATEIVGCSVELSVDRSQVTITERSAAWSPRHRIAAGDEEPRYIEIALADGATLQIEIRRFGPAEPIDEAALLVGGGDDGPELEFELHRSPACPLLDGVATNHG